MCFDFFSCLESYVVPITKLEIEKKDPINFGKYHCKITLNNFTEKKVILSSVKIMTLWDAMQPAVKKAVFFPPFFYNFKNARSPMPPQKIFDKIQKGKYNQPANLMNQISNLWD